MATVLGLWLDAPGGPVRIPDPEKLIVGGCGKPASEDNPAEYVGVACDDPDAEVLVLELLAPADDGEPHCPYGTDDVVDARPSTLVDAVTEADDDEEREVTEVACVRNLHPPHPGDPGAGGGQLTAGDCFYVDIEDEELVEVACAGDDQPPAFQALDVVDDPQDCPDETEERVNRWSDLSPDDDGYQAVCAVPFDEDDAQP